MNLNMNTPPMNTAAKSALVQFRKTVDAFTRTLHGLMAICFTGAFVTAESETFRLLHVSLGYTLGGLFVARLAWGAFGPRHVSWVSMWGKLSGLPSWLHSLKTGQVAWRQGQNLYLTLTVVALLAASVAVVFTGVVTEQEWLGEWMEEVHEFFGNFMLLAVLAHLSGVILLSVWRRRNLAAPMLTGRVEGAGPDLIKSNHVTLAVLLLAAVLSFWIWQWQTSPQFQADTLFKGGFSEFVKAQSEDDDD